MWYEFVELDCVVVESVRKGFIKVFMLLGKDKILGVIIVLEYVGDLLVEFVIVMKYDLGLNKIFGIIYVYLIWVEGVKYVVGNWKCVNVFEKLFSYVEKFYMWCRG